MEGDIFDYLAELGTSWWDLLVILAASVLAYAATVAFIRLAGLRSMSKMSSFDFIVTVGVGAILGSTALGSRNLLHGVLAIAFLLGIQVSVAWLRRNANFGKIVDNQPLLLMADGTFLEDHLSRARVTRSEVIAKMREANVLNFSQVKAVVLETTGDISVLHGEAELEPDLFTDVVGAERIRDRT
jgi:uncharacterized membrane protein YcaP (DUF421 family)